MYAELALDLWARRFCEPELKQSPPPPPPYHLRQQNVYYEVRWAAASSGKKKKSMICLLDRLKNICIALVSLDGICSFFRSGANLA
jgi:hypothetical protein